MIALALDTALDRTAVAVSDGRRLAVTRIEAMDRGHAERLFALIEEAVAEAGLALAAIDRLVATVGPGSFTGIRIGLAAARGLALALDRPVIGVGTLEALAASLTEPPDGAVLAAIDARRGEIYAGLYDDRGAVLVPPFVADADAVLDRIAGAATVIVGSGAPILAHQAAVRGAVVPTVVPLAGPDPLALARLGLAAEPAARPPVPVYLRAPDARPQPAIVGLRA